MSPPSHSAANSPRDFVRSLIADGFHVRDGALWVEGRPVRAIAEAHGTPLFVYSGRSLDAACARARNCLPAAAGLYYSVKANPTLAIVRRLLRHCDGLEVASAGELAIAVRAGCPPEKTLFAGPGKTDAELTAAVDLRIGEIHVESTGEIERLGGIASARGRDVRVSLRVNPLAAVQGGGMRMGGRPTAFGIDEPQVGAALQLLRRHPRLTLSGLHIYAGTQNLDAEVLLAQYRHAKDLARKIASETASDIRSIDLGGGWGVPLFPGDAPLDLLRLSEGFSDLASSMKEDPFLSRTRLLIEPGRFLAAPAGLYVARVVDLKRSYGTPFVVLDGGMHHHLAASGNLGQTIKRNFPLVPIDDVDGPLDQEVELAGPLCTPLDTLGRKWAAPRLEPGDLVGVLQSGAYARSASPVGFLSHPPPAEVLVYDGDDALVRRRGTIEALFADQPE